MRIDEVIQQPGTMERLQQNSVLGRTNVARPGIVVRYDPDAKTVDVQLAVRDLHSRELPPLLTGVPVIFIGSFTYDIYTGDECLVIFADSSTDGWFQTGDISSPVTGRRHDLSDGFALVGVHSMPNKAKGENLNNILAKKAQSISIRSVAEWTEVWNEIKDMVIGSCATLYADPSAVSAIVGSESTSFWCGTISREAEDEFMFICRYEPNGILISKITGCSGTDRGLYSESNVSAILGGKLDKANVYNALDQTAEGFALDARQGKVLNDSKLAKANVYNNLDKTAEGFALDARQGRELDLRKAPFMEIISTDTTWAKIWEKLNSLRINYTANFRSHASATVIWTDGVRENTLWGTIGRRSDSQFVIMAQLNSRSFLTATIDGASASGVGTYSERIWSDEITALNTDVAGLVSDVANRVVGQRQMKAFTGSSSQQSIRIDAEVGAYFVILQIPGINRTWVGIIYVAGDGTTTASQINTAQTGISVRISGTNRFYVDFTYTSDSNLHMVSIPLRNTKNPTFH